MHPARAVCMIRETERAGKGNALFSSNRGELLPAGTGIRTFTSLAQPLTLYP